MGGIIVNWSICHKLQKRSDSRALESGSRSSSDRQVSLGGEDSEKVAGGLPKGICF